MDLPPADSTVPVPAAGLRHAALFYRGVDEIASALGSFARTAADGDEPLLVVLSRESFEGVARGLEDSGADLHVRDMTEVGANPARLLPALASWLDEVDGPARVVSEPIWPERTRAEVVECLRHEAALNLALAGRAVQVLCPYDAEHLDADVLAGAAMTHPRLIDDAGPRASCDYGDPAMLAAGVPWPLPEPLQPVSEHEFDGDLGALRHAVAADPVAEALEPGRREDLVFAINEAANNALRHGDGACRTLIWREEDWVVAEVRSDTPIPDVLAGRRAPDPNQLGGRGLWLVNQVCDLVELRSGPRGARLRMHLRAAA